MDGKYALSIPFLNIWPSSLGTGMSLKEDWNFQSNLDFRYNIGLDHKRQGNKW